jgi:hypothetical protein
VQLLDVRALRELPGERMLAPTRSHQEHLHQRECTAVSGLEGRRPI